MKILVFVIILVLSTWIGISCVGSEKQKLVFCREAYMLIEAFRNGISKRITVDEIIRCFLLENSPVFLKGDNKNDIFIGMERALQVMDCKREVVILKKFFDRVGKNKCIDDEYCGCDEALAELRSMLEDAQLEYRKKYRLYPRIAAVCGLIVCITLL